jgi:hypothetical protein
MVGQRVGETLYHLHMTTINRSEQNEDYAGAAKSNLRTVHQRFANLNCSDIIRMKKENAVKGLRINGSYSTISCEASIFGKCIKFLSRPKVVKNK